MQRHVAAMWHGVLLLCGGALPALCHLPPAGTLTHGCCCVYIQVEQWPFFHPRLQVPLHPLYVLQMPGWSPW